MTTYGCWLSTLWFPGSAELCEACPCTCSLPPCSPAVFCRPAPVAVVPSAALHCLAGLAVTRWVFIYLASLHDLQDRALLLWPSWPPRDLQLSGAAGSQYPWVFPMRCNLLQARNNLTVWHSRGV
jgi:hypothetical protein